ncbi:hypothetical protein HID58_051898, partial [Brassica napus]
HGNNDDKDIKTKYCVWDNGILGVADFVHDSFERVSDYPCEVTILAFGPLISLAIPIKHESSLASKVKMIVILGGAFFALGNINPPAEANIQHPLNLLFNLLSMKECRFHVLWVFPFLCRCIVTWKQLMFGFMSGVNITDITTQLKQTELGTSNLMECYLHNPVCFLEAVQPDLFKYKKWVVWGICVGHRLMDQALKKSYYIDFKLQRKRKNCRWNGSNSRLLAKL